jgi:hypothetical protein
LREFIRKFKGVEYYDFSVKACYNFEKPFLYLIRKLLKDETIVTVEGPAELPPLDSVSL